MKIKVYNLERKEVGDLELSDEVFGTDVKEHLLHEVVTAQRASRRAGTQRTKERSAVAGTNSNERHRGCSALSLMRSLRFRDPPRPSLAAAGRNRLDRIGVRWNRRRRSNDRVNQIYFFESGAPARVVV